MLPKITTIRPKNKYLLLQEYALINLQANKKLISRARAIPPHPEVKEMLLHIWQIESGWFACLQRSRDTFQLSGFATLKEILESCVELSDKFSDYILALNEAQIKEKVHVYIPGILDCNIPRFELIKICFDQSKYYRDQIRKITAYTELAPTPITNFIPLMHTEEITSIA